MTFIKSLKSFYISMKASSKFGRSLKLEKKGRMVEALATAREGLKILDTMDVDRIGGPEGSVLACLTINVEKYANELKQPGADLKDIRDSLAFLKGIGSVKNPTYEKTRADWIPYFEKRLEDLRVL